MPMTHFSKAQEIKQPHMGREGIHAFLGDVAVSNDEDKTIAAGFFRMEKSDEPLVYEYTYHEMKVIVEGSMVISDETGQKVLALPGDHDPAAFEDLDVSNTGVSVFAGRHASHAD